MWLKTSRLRVRDRDPPFTGKLEEMKISIVQCYQRRWFWFRHKKETASTFYSICHRERCVCGSCLTASMSLGPAVIWLRFPGSTDLTGIFFFLLKVLLGGIRTTVRMTVWHVYLTPSIHCHWVGRVKAPELLPHFLSVQSYWILDCQVFFPSDTNPRSSVTVITSLCCHPLILNERLVDWCRGENQNFQRMEMSRNRDVSWSWTTRTEPGHAVWYHVGLKPGLRREIPGLGWICLHRRSRGSQENPRVR